MIGSIRSVGRQILNSAPPKDVATDGRFDAALQAASKAEARESARQSELQAIREKGFRQWVGEMQIEKLKEELREKIMAAMGLAEEDLAQMAPAIQQILERKIQEAVENQLEEEISQLQAGPNGQATRTTSTAQENGPAASGQPALKAEVAQPLARQDSHEKKDENGKTCPVIPALAWPGLAPGALF